MEVALEGDRGVKGLASKATGQCSGQNGRGKCIFNFAGLAYRDLGPWDQRRSEIEFVEQALFVVRYAATTLHEIGALAGRAH